MTNRRGPWGADRWTAARALGALAVALALAGGRARGRAGRRRAGGDRRRGARARPARMGALGLPRDAAPERFEVEILGVLKDVQPGVSYVLGRLTGQDLEKTGVIAGMSGSPVYVDDRLVGAVAFAWPFAHEAIAGITPIGAMRAIGDGGALAGPGRPAGGLAGRARRARPARANAGRGGGQARRSRRRRGTARAALGRDRLRRFDARRARPPPPRARGGGGGRADPARATRSSAPAAPSRRSGSTATCVSRPPAR